MSATRVPFPVLWWFAQIEPKNRSARPEALAPHHREVGRGRQTRGPRGLASRCRRRVAGHEQGRGPRADGRFRCCDHRALAAKWLTMADWLTADEALPNVDGARSRIGPDGPADHGAWVPLRRCATGAAPDETGAGSGSRPSQQKTREAQRQEPDVQGFMGASLPGPGEEGRPRWLNATGRQPVEASRNIIQRLGVDQFSDSTEYRVQATDPHAANSSARRWFRQRIAPSAPVGHPHRRHRSAGLACNLPGAGWRDHSGISRQHDDDKPQKRCVAVAVLQHLSSHQSTQGGLKCGYNEAVGNAVAAKVVNGDAIPNRRRCFVDVAPASTQKGMSTANAGARLSRVSATWRLQ